MFFLHFNFRIYGEKFHSNSSLAWPENVNFSWTMISRICESFFYLFLLSSFFSIAPANAFALFSRPRAFAVFLVLNGRHGPLSLCYIFFFSKLTKCILLSHSIVFFFFVKYCAILSTHTSFLSKRMKIEICSSISIFFISNPLLIKILLSLETFVWIQRTVLFTFHIKFSEIFELAKWNKSKKNLSKTYFSAFIKNMIVFKISVHHCSF